MLILGSWHSVIEVLHAIGRERRLSKIEAPLGFANSESCPVERVWPGI
jgi:hypothetical protein